jgi:hypothetical protein
VNEMGFIKWIVGMGDRTQQATERINVALEDIADALERARDNVKSAVYGEVIPALPAPEVKEVKSRKK